MSEVGAFQLIKQGNLRVEIHFAEALTTTINVIMYAEFDNVIEIDRPSVFPVDRPGPCSLSRPKVRLIFWVVYFWHILL
jgi:hypothetical protein